MSFKLKYNNKNNDSNVFLSCLIIQITPQRSHLNDSLLPMLQC